MDNLTNKLIHLVNDYINCSVYVVSILKSNFHLGNMEILKSRRLNLIPKEGNVEGMYFNFHGGGCHFELENDIIDIDFGPENRVDGFDLDRLKQFLKSKTDRYPEFKNGDVLKNTFNELIRQKIILNPKSFPNIKHCLIGNVLEFEKSKKIIIPTAGKYCEPIVMRGTDSFGNWEIVKSVNPKDTIPYRIKILTINEVFSGTHKIVFYKDNVNKLLKMEIFSDSLYIVCRKGLYNFDKNIQTINELEKMTWTTRP